MKEHYILQFPFTSAAGNTIDSLQLRRLKVKDMRNARRISEKPEEWDEPLMAALDEASDQIKIEYGSQT